MCLLSKVSCTPAVSSFKGHLGAPDCLVRKLTGPRGIKTITSIYESHLTTHPSFHSSSCLLLHSLFPFNPSIHLANHWLIHPSLIFSSFPVSFLPSIPLLHPTTLLSIRPFSHPSFLPYFPHPFYSLFNLSVHLPSNYPTTQPFNQ